MPDFYETGTGWITDRGELIGCKSFRHKNVLWANIKCQEVKDLIEKVEETERGCCELADAGEHPEWHVYEMCKDWAQDEIVRIAYAQRFIRIGIDRRRKEIGVEGHPNALKNRMQQIKSIVERFERKNGEKFTLSVNPIE